MIIFNAGKSIVCWSILINCQGNCKFILFWKALELFLSSDPRNLPQKNTIWQKNTNSDVGQVCLSHIIYSSENLEMI